MKEYNTAGYTYLSPTERGFIPVKVKASNHNKVFKTTFTRKGIRNILFNTFNYYDNGACILVQKLPSLFGKVFCTILAPFFILLYGISEMKYEYSRLYFPKKYGSFTTYTLEGKERDILLGKD